MKTNFKNEDWVLLVRNIKKTVKLLIVIGLIIILQEPLTQKYVLSKLDFFNIIFMSILLEALPFLLIGIMISAIIGKFVSSEYLIKFLENKKHNQVWSYVIALLAGGVFPVCDCAIIPIVGRLIKKGVPPSLAITFMLAAPFTNPIVIIATFLAFPYNPDYAVWRIFLGLSIALIIGLVIRFFVKEKDVLKEEKQQAHHHHTGCTCCAEKSGKKETICQETRQALNWWQQSRQNIIDIFNHAIKEFFNVGGYLIMGAFFSGMLQVLIPRSSIMDFRGNGFISLLIMMATAFFFSICSTSDAFVAKSFAYSFSYQAIMGFLILSPMLDLKNLMILLATFKKGFVFKLVCLISSISLIVVSLFSLII